MLAFTNGFYFLLLLF